MAAPITRASTVSWVDTSNRSAVANSYLNLYLPSSSVATGWTGNVSTGNAGATTQAYKDAVLLRVNWFRQMAGVPTPIVFSATYNSGDQQAALMMSANGQMNNTPPSSWMYYTSAGADAASHSNLCMNIPYLNDPGCVSQYVQDYGTGNTAVGHRRWLMYPQTQNMGTGDVQPPYPLAFANALYVIDSHLYDARPATRDPFVAWPPKGYVPYQVVPGRWSFSYPAADFTNATVTMQRNGSAVAVRLETPQQGYADNSIVWVPDNIDANVSTRWPVPAVDTPITVTVAHVLVAGVDTTFAYTVTVIDPSTGINISGHITSGTTAVSGATISLSGGPSTTSDSAGAYRFGPLAAGTYSVIPSLTGYAFTPASRSISATASTADFSASQCDYSGIGGNYNVGGRAGGLTYIYTLPSGCPWTAMSNASWLVIPPTSASGVGQVSVASNYSTNNGAARSAVVTVSSHAVNVTQASAGQSLAGPVSAGIFLNGKWTLDTNGSGAFDASDQYFSFQINGAGDKPIIGDWNGSGHAKVGVYSAGFWALDYNGNGQWDGSVTDKFYAFGGNAGEIPIVGDWNGDGRSKIGYYYKGFWALDYNGNGVWDGPSVDRFYGFGGNTGEIPVTGDWNGDGRTKVGYYLNGKWALDYNGNGVWDGPSVDRYNSFSLGSGEKPIIGDWNASGTAKIGVWKGGFWLLDTNGSGAYESSDQLYGFGGNPGETPIVGDWNGDGKSKIGYFLNGFWTMDYNGNGSWNGTGPQGDRFAAFGGNTGETPIPGKW